MRCVQRVVRRGRADVEMKKPPNEVLRRARLSRPSPTGDALTSMSRQELADAVNSWVMEHHGWSPYLDGHYVGKLERGVARWPRAHLRAGLRAVLAKPRDSDLGFSNTRHSEAVIEA